MDLDLNPRYQPNPKGHKVAILLAEGFNGSDVRSIQAAVEAVDGACKLVAKELGELKGADGTKMMVDKTYVTTASVLFDAVYVPGGAKSAEMLMQHGYAKHFINEQFLHNKPIAATEEAIGLLKVCDLADVSLAEGERVVSDQSVVTSGGSAEGEVADQFKPVLPGTGIGAEASGCSCLRNRRSGPAEIRNTEGGESPSPGPKPASGDDDVKDRLRVDSRMMQILWGTLVTLIAVSLACRVAFHLGGGGSYLEHLIALFDVDMEQNLPTVFAMLLLAFAAQLFGFAAVVEGRTSGRPAWAWWVLSGVLLMMAVDEAASLHEKLIEPVRSMIGEGAGGIFHYAWVIPGAAFVLVAAPFLIRFVLSQPPRARRYMFLAGALYVTGALGLEFVGGAYADVNGTMNLAYGMITLVEESLEMVGVILLIQGVFAYLAYAHGEVSLGFGRMQVATPVQDRNGSSADRPAGASVGVRPPAQAPLPVPSTPPPREELA